MVIEMDVPTRYLLGLTFIPKISSDVSAGTGGDIHLVGISVSAIRAFPPGVPIHVFMNVNRLCHPTHMAIRSLDVNLAIHNMIIDMLNDRIESFDVFAKIYAFYIANTQRLMGKFIYCLLCYFIFYILWKVLCKFLFFFILVFTIIFFKQKLFSNHSCINGFF